MGLLGLLDVLAPGSLSLQTWTRITAPAYLDLQLLESRSWEILSLHNCVSQFFLSLLWIDGWMDRQTERETDRQILLVRFRRKTLTNPPGDNYCMRSPRARQGTISVLPAPRARELYLGQSRGSRPPRRGRMKPGGTRAEPRGRERGRNKRLSPGRLLEGRSQLEDRGQPQLLPARGGLHLGPGDNDFMSSSCSSSWGRDRQ